MSAALIPVPQALLDALAGEAPIAPVNAPPFQASTPCGGHKLLVDKWLNDRGIAHRTKEQPDRKGRAVYVLRECPFDPSHGDPDSCIMQEPGGKLSAKCFHNSCVANTWQMFKEKIGAPSPVHYDPPLRSRSRTPNAKVKLHESEPRFAGTKRPAEEDVHEESLGLPKIQGNNRQLRDITADALSAIIAQNEPPKVLQRGRLLTRVRSRDCDLPPILEPMTDLAVRGLLARSANWFQLRQLNNGMVVTETSPPMDVVKDLVSLPDWDGILNIQAVVECPVFSRAGKLIIKPGFDREAQIWFEPAPSLAIPSIPPKPTSAEIQRAREMLLDEFLGDFPFKDDASRANVLSALLLPFVRPMVDGPTPLHLIDAPTEGTGKTLLASIITIPALGTSVEGTAEGDSNEEWRKRITAIMAEGKMFVLLDNLSRILDSAPLASVITQRTWSDRLLGVSKLGSFPVNTIWLATGNNSKLSREMIRRTIWCRLDAKMESPWEGRKFRHKNIAQWAKRHRGELLGAALTLCQAWIAAGRPAGSKSLGMFESWAETIGGIMEVAGVSGFMENAQVFRANATDQADEWRSFMMAWWERFGCESVGVAQLYELAIEKSLLDRTLGDKSPQSQRIRLGFALGKMTDRVVSGFRVEKVAANHSGCQQFRLEPWNE
jgi:hypothetical protein